MTASTFAIPYGIATTSSIAAIWVALIAITRSVTRLCTGSPAAFTNTPEMSATTPRRRNWSHASSSIASNSVDCSAAHEPNPTTALVTESKCLIASATSGCCRSARAVAASGTTSGA